MRSKLARCTVVEMPAEVSVGSENSQPTPRDLLPWADPYIAQLLVRYRLQAALDDSLAFVTNRSSGAFRPN